METLEEAVSSYLHICFIAHLEFPNGSGILSTFLQRWVAKLDEHGTKATGRKDTLVNKQDKTGRAFNKAFEDYGSKVFVLTNGLKSS